MNRGQNTNLPPRDTIQLDRHPILTRRYTIVTPMLLTLANEIVQWIKNGVTGAFIEGDPRRGKTKARRLLGILLQREFPRLPVFSMIARLYALPSERVFFGDLLKAFKNSLHAEGTAAQRRDRLIEGIVSSVQVSGQEKVVLLIDQAHRLLEMHYEWLVDLHDELSERGIELFVFLFGQRELSTVCEELRRSGRTQIIGRFMVDRLEYFGIRSVSELRECLACYDDGCRFPEDTDWTFTRFFFPEAFARGWRLADQATAVWKAFEEVKRATALRDQMEIPMQHFVRALERFLVESDRTTTGEPLVSHQRLVQFVAGTAYGAVPRGDTPPSDDEDDDESA